MYCYHVYAHYSSKPLSAGVVHVRYQVSEQTTTVAHLLTAISSEFGLGTPGGLRLQLDGCAILPNSPISVLRDSDALHILSVPPAEPRGTASKRKASATQPGAARPGPAKRARGGSGKHVSKLPAAEVAAPNAAAAKSHPGVAAAATRPGAAAAVSESSSSREEETSSEESSAAETTAKAVNHAAGV